MQTFFIQKLAAKMYIQITKNHEWQQQKHANFSRKK